MQGTPKNRLIYDEDIKLVNNLAVEAQSKTLLTFQLWTQQYKKINVGRFKTVMMLEYECIVY